MVVHNLDETMLDSAVSNTTEDPVQTGGRDNNDDDLGRAAIGIAETVFEEEDDDDGQEFQAGDIRMEEIVFEEENSQEEMETQEEIPQEETNEQNDGVNQEGSYETATDWRYKANDNSNHTNASRPSYETATARTDRADDNSSRTAGARTSPTSTSETDGGSSGTKNKCNKDSICIGTFKINGEKKHYAVVPPLLIRSQPDLEALVKEWRLSVPNFILETNESNEHRDNVISSENAPYILRDIFQPDEAKTTRPDNEQDIDPTHNDGSSSAGTEVPTGTADKQKDEVKTGTEDKDKDEEKGSQDEEKAFRSKKEKGLSWIKKEAPWLESLKQMQEIKGKKDLSDDDWTFINKYLQRKTIHALSSMVSAADMTNGWILCHGAPSSNEKMLEIAIERTRSNPTVLVVDDLARYEGQLEQDSPFRALLRTLEKSATPLNLQGTDGNDQTNKESVDFEVFDNYDMVQRRGERESQRSLAAPDSQRSLDRVDGRQMWVRTQRSGVVPDANSRRSLNRNLDGHPLWGRTNSGGWTARFPWKSGTHFIFSSGMDDFEPSLLGPAGYVCMNGHVNSDNYYAQHPKTTGYMIREAILTVKPCILFNNTGAETQMYARLIREVQRRDLKCQLEEQQALRARALANTRGFFAARQNGASDKNDSTHEHSSKVRIYLRQNAWSLWEYAVKGYVGAKDQGNRGVLTLADVVQIIDLYCDNPRLFRKIVVTVDPLNDTPDSIVKAMTLSFARSVMESREVGAGDADKKAVEQSWRFHFQLEKSKLIKRKVRDFLYSLYIAAGFSTTLVAVLYSLYLANNDTTDGASEKTAKDFTRWFAMFLAAIVSLSSSILSLTSADNHINKIETAQAKITSEILRFRMRVGKYSVNPHEKKEDDETNGASNSSKRRLQSEKEVAANRRAGTQSQNLSKAMHDSRDRFSRSMEVIMQELSSVDLHYDKSDQRSGHEKESCEFNAYVQSRFHLSSSSDNRNDVVISGLMTPEEYYKLRLLPLLEHVEKEEDYLRLSTRSLQISSMICSSLAVILGAAGSVEPIPAVIAGSTGLFQVLKVNDFERRFEIASAAARELRGLDSRWDSLSDLDHQMRSSVVHLVRTCEQLALQFATTSAIQIDKAEIGMKTGSSSDPFTPVAFGKYNT